MLNNTWIPGNVPKDQYEQCRYAIQFSLLPLFTILAVYFSFIKRENQDILHETQDSASSALDLPANDVLVLFGSQTGTAEDYARKLGRLLADQCSLQPLVLSMEDLTLEQLLRLSTRGSQSGLPIMLMLVVSTYGDGEPPDGAVDFYNALKERCESSDQAACAAISYAVFGLGNSNYEKFNQVSKDLDGFLCNLGGSRICESGVGDDNAGTTDEDYQEWKDKLLSALVTSLGLQVSAPPRTSSNWEVEDVLLSPDGHTSEVDCVYRGERTQTEILHHGLTVAPYTVSNPYYARREEMNEMYNPTCGRHCLHIELNISGSDLQYETGDHVAIWPVNPEAEVERFLRVLGLLLKRETVFCATSTLHPPDSHGLPGATTYSTAARHYLDICGPVSRSTLQLLAQFAPSSDAKEDILRLAGDKNEFNVAVHDKKLNLGQTLELLGHGSSWSAIPFYFVLDILPALRPRSYSIASSPKVSPGLIHITAAIKQEQLGDGHVFVGLTSQYFLALAKSDTASSPNSSHELRLPRSLHSDCRVAISIRSSHFRLPIDTLTPIIMIGPGTGVAPFRAFLAEKELQARNGAIGKCMLFTGCRRRDEDFLYAKEWQAYKQSLGSDFVFYTAFSQENAEKVYVQHRMKEQAEFVCHLLIEKAANLYICGAANMARDVSSTLVDMLVQHRSYSVDAARQMISNFKASRKFQEDVW